jgi:membrane fusion protein (multidrug efflux system)
VKTSSKNIIIILVVACLMAGIYWFYHENRSPQPETAGTAGETRGPVASVNVVSLKKTLISAQISAYGEVVPAPGAIQVISVPYESQVIHVMVSTAQKITANDVLFEIGLSPDTKLQLDQAQNDYKVSEESLGHVQQLFDLKLATNNQLLQAKQKFQQAALRLESLRQRGITGTRTIRSGITGLVSKVYVQEGAIVPAGNPLAEIVAQDRLEVRLEVEAEDVSHLIAGESVLLTYVNVPEPKGVTGKIRKISRAVNLSSRLVDVFVSLPGSSRFLLGEFVLGRVTVASSKGLVVPRNAVLPEDGRRVLYTVNGGHAVKHIVRLGLESGDKVEILGGGLGPGEEVIVKGNYELRDGMAVRVEKTSP